MWIAIFSSYYKHVKTDTPMRMAADPQEAINDAKKILTEETLSPWTEVDDDELGRKILVRQALRSKEANQPVLEYGWFFAMKVPMAGERNVSNQTAEDSTAWNR